MKTSIAFNITGRHESHHGTATIISRNSTLPIATLVAENFGENGKFNLIGTADQIESDGYNHRYKIYECYADPASDDYLYFAISCSETN